MNTTSRRTVLTGLAILPLAALPAMAAPQPPDTILTTAWAELVAVEQEEGALLIRPEYRDVDCQNILGFRELEIRLAALTALIIATKAEGVRGLAVKARAIKTDFVGCDYYSVEQVSTSLADDIVRLFPNEAA